MSAFAKIWIFPKTSKTRELLPPTLQPASFETCQSLLIEGLWVHEGFMALESSACVLFLSSARLSGISISRARVAPKGLKSIAEIDECLFNSNVCLIDAPLPFSLASDPVTAFRWIHLHPAAADYDQKDDKKKAKERIISGTGNLSQFLFKQCFLHLLLQCEARAKSLQDPFHRGDRRRHCVLNAEKMDGCESEKRKTRPAKNVLFMTVNV